MNKKLAIVFYFLGLGLFLSGSVAALTPEDGWWWNPAEPGRGFNIETQNDTVFIATFIYDESGNPIWYSGSGTLNENSEVTVPALRFEGGQCIGCPFQEAQVTDDVGPLTVQFTSQMTANVQWAGATVPIERFNFNLGDNFQRLLGEWMIVTGSPGAEFFLGDRILFQNVETEEGQPVVRGHRTGATEQLFFAAPIELEQEEDQGLFFGLLDVSPEFVQSFLFRLTGLNTMEGISALHESEGLDEENPEQFLDELLEEGALFIGKRLRGEGTAAVASPTTIDAKASPQSLSIGDFLPGLEGNHRTNHGQLYFQQQYHTPRAVFPLTKINVHLDGKGKKKLKNRLREQLRRIKIQIK